MQTALLVYLAVAMTISPALAEKRKPKPDQASDAAAAETDFTARQDAVTHTPVRNQGSAGFCWAYTLAAFIEGEAKKKNIDAVISPEYLGVYHMYLQLQKHLSWFENHSHGKQEDLDATAEEATKRVYIQPHFFQPDEGSDEESALQEIEISGVVPQEAFDFKLGTDRREDSFENSIKNFIKTNMFSEKNLASYKQIGPNGINDELFDALSSALGIHPPKPDQTFNVEGRNLTPKTYLTEFLKFDPNDYVERAFSLNGQAGLNLIRDAMKKNFAVPIGFNVFDDKNGSNDAQLEAERVGDFSTRFCPNGKCTQVDGGHEVLGINWTEDSNGNVTSIIVKNSWGNGGGRNDRGQKVRDGSDTGYYILEADYLEESSPYWTILVPKNLR
jgi:aminopeptidase C